MSRRGENIRKRKDGRWEGRYIKGYDSKKQKARYASVYGKTYAETKQKLDEAKYKSSIGVVYVDAKNKLFGEIINSWFNAKKINLKPSSIIKYQNLIEKHILPELGHRKLRELNADLFYTFLDAQQKNGNKKNGGMSYKVGSMIGQGLTSIGRSKSKLEEEQNYYACIIDIFDEIVS